jgi:1,2-diacylglycerol 3-alpha-glucosyltransferase
MVIFDGGRPWEEIPLYYHLGDVFAVASTSETQGLTYVEAMASKVPVVVKRDPSVEGVVRHKETGYCFDNYQEAADVLYDALIHKEEAKKIAEEGYNSISHLSAAHFAKSVESVYQEALSDQTQTRRKLFIIPSLKLKDSVLKDVSK